MATREIDAIGEAIIATEKEIAGDAWGQEASETDSDGDRSLEELGEGLEGQHEAEGDDEPEGDEPDGEGDADGEQQDGEAKGDKDGDKPAAKQDAEADEPRGRVPAGRLREANDRARQAEAERDTIKSTYEATTKTLQDQVEALSRQIQTLTQQPKPQAAQAAQTETKPDAPAIPDMFEDPKGFQEALLSRIEGKITSTVSPLQQQLENQRVGTSFAIAHTSHKDAFEQAYQAVSSLNPNDPNDRATVQRIWGSANPGEELVSWHRRNATLQRVGSDPEAYEQRLRDETRQALMKDTEFRRQLLDDLRREAGEGDGGKPRTTTRLPKSLNGTVGSNAGARFDHSASDDSDQAIADSAWR